MLLRCFRTRMLHSSTAASLDVRPCKSFVLCPVYVFQFFSFWRPSTGKEKQGMQCHCALSWMRRIRMSQRRRWLGCMLSRHMRLKNLRIRRLGLLVEMCSMWRMLRVVEQTWRRVNYIVEVIRRDLGADTAVWDVMEIARVTLTGFIIAESLPSSKSQRISQKPRAFIHTN